MSKVSAKYLLECCRLAREIAAGAGEILRKGFRRRMTVNYKGRIDPVTEYDLKSEKFIVNKLNRFFPDHDILTEEGSNKDESSEFCWIIDPIDGTVNYAHGFPMYCVSIGLVYNNKPVVGVVYDPERDEMFSAVKGKGTKLGNRKISVSREQNLERSLLATGFAYDIATARRNNLGLFSKMAKIAQGIRRPGSAALDLCWLADGRIDGFWELGLYPWDTAAASLIVREAGGKVTRLDGSDYSIFDPDLLAANSSLHKKMQAVLTGG